MGDYEAYWPKEFSLIIECKLWPLWLIWKISGLNVCPVKNTGASLHFMSSYVFQTRFVAFLDRNRVRSMPANISLIKPCKE